MSRLVPVSAAFVVAFAFVCGPASAQATPTVVVTPNSDLVNGQSVSVTGSGWPASTSLVIVECSNTRGITCFTQEHVTTDPEGSFSTQYVVVDDGCSSCIIGVSLEDFSSPVFASLTFAAPRPEPKPDLVIRRRSDGALFFDDVYTTAPTPYGHPIAAGSTWTFAVLLQNDGDAGDLTVSAPSVAAPFTVRYFIGYFDVTSWVTNGAGITWPAMAPGASQLLAVQFTAAPTTPTGAKVDITMNASSPLSGLQDSLDLRVTASSP